jgi:sensor c-di-GMP phosphodiesterase-like protein
VSSHSKLSNGGERASRSDPNTLTRNQPARKRPLIVLTTCALILAGAGLGWHLAEQLQHRQASSELQNAADRVLTRLDDIIQEADQVFGYLDALGLETCSDELLLEMRTRLFEAHFIRDIGGIENYDLYCSTALGRIEQPYQSGPPDISLPRGIGLRTDRAVLASETLRTLVVEQADFNALIDPRVVTDLTSSLSEGRIYVRAADQANRQWHPIQRAEILERGRNQRHISAELTALACSPHTLLCVELRRSEAPGQAGQRETRAVISSLGGALGLALFFAGASLIRERNTPERALRKAIDQRLIRAAYQPILTLPEQNLVGFEALARWIDSAGNQIPAETFIDLAENCGLIDEISALMIEQIGDELGEWLSSRPDQRVAINIAPSELNDPGLIDNLDRHLLQRGVDPGQIILEITERTMLASDTAARDIERLTRRGFRIFADDFGVGYCGLGYLNDLDMHGIKISQSFTAAVATDSPKAALVPRIIGMARELGLEIVIEGVEQPEQCKALSELGPLMVQGWYFSRELSAAQLMRFFGR